VNEALANIMRHAYGGAKDRPIQINADPVDGSGGNHIRIAIRDWGNGVNPASLPEKQYDPLTPGGLGLICMRKMMDETVYTPQPDGGMLVTMTKKRTTERRNDEATK
jgi:anti-sigma regulatory factor (Ser/Thr protein kinase)